VYGSPASSVPISVTGPVSPAIDRTRKILFGPFELRKWFVLGFCAWLASLGRGGGGGTSWKSPVHDYRHAIETVGDWLRVHLGLVIVLAVVLGLLFVGLAILMAWLSSRGQLMFLDGVVHDRGAVVEPWGRFRALGDSLFGFRIVVALIALATLGVLVVPLVLALIPRGWGSEVLGPGVIALLGLWLVALLAAACGFALVGMAVTNFIVPIMWLRGCRVMAAWSEFLPLLRAHAGTFVLYVLFRIVLLVGFVVIAVAVTCVTCCIAALPYIGTVVLLPVHVFLRCYSIGFLSQFGPGYAALAPTGARQ
jgi:hypothetical protein